MVDFSDDSEVLSDETLGWEFVNHPSWSGFVYRSA
jgi:hypothetical protein